MSQLAFNVSQTDQNVQLDPSWLSVIGSEFDQPYMKSLKDFLKKEKEAGKTIYPNGVDIFNALNTTPLNKVRIVILGQDPYHGPDQAHGLSFSVQKGIRKPPSLLNIYKEIQSDLGIEMPDHGDLTGWAKQGVLLLNATLTVEAHQAGSHQGKGWEIFTDSVIRALNDQFENVVYLLWGAHAQKKGAIIDDSKNCVLKSVHPSPLSAHRGFMGCRHFSQANEYLVQQGRDPIDWAAI